MLHTMVSFPFSVLQFLSLYLSINCCSWLGMYPVKIDITGVEIITQNNPTSTIFTPYFGFYFLNIFCYEF